MLGSLPSLGNRSARRIALHLLSNKFDKMLPLAKLMQEVAENMKICKICGNFDSEDPCHLCTDGRRDKKIICVVENVADLWAIERSNYYNGQYHILGGVLSALDGKGPDELGIPNLLQKIANNAIEEVIIATNATIEGQTTAIYLQQQIAEIGVRTTRLSQGVPIGSELDYLDDGTLGAALKARH